MVNTKEVVFRELSEHGIIQEDCCELEEIRYKDGIFIYRVICKEKVYILKYFANKEFTREIENYKILRKLDIPTISCYGMTHTSLLLEDISKSDRYRLGNEEDLSDPEVAKALANWYIELHRKGVGYVSQHKTAFYREVDAITKENIEMVRDKSGTADNPVWERVLNNLPVVFEKISKVEETLTYNDFYWTNLVVSKDKKEAFMFDYNFLGAGFRHNDMTNVCASLKNEAREAFIQAYGAIHESERIIDAGISILISLIFAYNRQEFPKWGMASLEAIHNGKLEEAFKTILARA